MSPTLLQTLCLSLYWELGLIPFSVDTIKNLLLDFFFLILVLVCLLLFKKRKEKPP